jgi:hypothetical protein
MCYLSHLIGRTGTIAGVTAGPTMHIVANDPWDFVGSDGSNVFPGVSASQRDRDGVDEFPWVLDFGDRLASGRFFALALPIEEQHVLLAGDTVDCALLALPEQRADPRLWRGGLAARVSARLD